jgi:F-type H+-transporting ATPase subunit epsilon
MAHTFHLTIAKVGHNLFDGEAVAVTLPGDDGVFTVMANHEAFVTPLKIGDAKIQLPNGERETVALTTTGIAEVSNNQATVIL